MGRTGLYEMLIVDENVSDMILDRAMAFDIRRYARTEQGMRTLREEGFIKAVQGITSAEEVMIHTDKFED
jgi:type II secretory ATPase GspE/PulE/Tfp pilus assembly ATPase PilB-like protein